MIFCYLIIIIWGGIACVWLKVWSSDAEQTHTPPSNLVMKDQTWPLGDDMKTTLVDAKGEVCCHYLSPLLASELEYVNLVSW